MNLPARGCGQVGPLSQHVSEMVRMGRAASVGRQQLPAFGVHCSATFTSNVKLPATHLSSSSLALQQLALSSGVNRASSDSPPVAKVAPLPCGHDTIGACYRILRRRNGALICAMSPTLLGHDVVIGPRLQRAFSEHKCRSAIRYGPPNAPPGSG